MIGLLALLIIDAVLFVASSLLIPKPEFENAQSDELQRPTSKEGDPIPVVWGTMPVSANATFFGEVLAQEETQKIQTSLFSSHRVTTGYNYSALMQCVLCHGPVDELLDIVFQDNLSLAESKPHVEYTVGTTTDGKEAWVAITVTTPYTAPALPATPDDGLTLTDPDDGSEFIVTAPEIFGGYQHGGGLVGHFRMYWGTPTQHADPALRHSLANELLNSTFIMPEYEGVAHIVFGFKSLWEGARDDNGNKIDAQGHIVNDNDIAPFNFGEMGSIPGMTFILRRCPNGLGLPPEQVNIGGGANPACCIFEVLTNVTWGLQIPESEINVDTFVSVAAVLASENFGVNMTLDSLGKGDAIITELLRYIDGQVQQNPTTGLLELSLNRADYVIDDLILLDDDNSTSEITRPHWSSLINEVRVTYSQRQGGRFKTVTTQPVDDIASQHDLNLTVATKVDFSAVRDPVLANRLAVRALRLGATPLARAKITADRTASSLKVGQPFRLTNAIAGINNHVFRAASINWGSRLDGKISIDAIEDVFDLESPFYDNPIDAPGTWTGVGPTNSLRIVPIATHDENFGYLELQLSGGSGNVTRVQFREKSGASDWTAWHDNDAPDRFFDKVTLDDAAPSQIGWQVLGMLKSGEEGPLADGVVDFNVTNGSVALRLDNFREILRTPKIVRYGWKLPVPNVIYELDAWGKLSDELADPPPAGGEDLLWRDTEVEAPDQRLAGDTVIFEASVPPNGKVQTWELIPYSKDGLRGFGQRVKILPTPDVPRFGRLTTTTDPVGLSVTVTALDIDDPQALGGRLFVYLNHDFAEDPDDLAPADGWLDVALTPYTATFADDFTLADGVHTSFLLQSIRIHPDRGKRIFVEFVNSNGVTSGKIPFTLLGSGGIIDENGQLIDASINRAEAFAANIKPYSVYDTLPATGRPNEVALLTSNSKLYRWDGSAWTAAVEAPDISGVMTASQLADHIIDIAKVASSLAPPEILSSLPPTPGAGRTALFNGELYRSTPDGSGWTKAVQTVDLSGQIATLQIQLGAIDNTLIAVNAVQSTNIADDAITTPKLLAGAVTTNRLAASAVTANEIAAGAVTTTRLAAGAVTANEIAAGAVTTTRLAAGAVTANELAANSVIAGKVLAGAISTTELAANAVTAAKIGAGEIITTHMTAGTIAGDRIAANSLNATKIVTGSLAALTATLDAVSAGVLSAGAIVATAIHAGAVDATKVTTALLTGVGTAGGGTLSNLGIIVAGKLVSVASPNIYLDLNATGANPFLKLLSTFVLYADGTATFSGTLSAAGGTFSGTVTSNTFTTSQANFSGAASFFGTIGVYAGSVGSRTTGAVRFYDYSSALAGEMYDNTTTDQMIIWARTDLYITISAGANYEISSSSHRLTHPSGNTVISSSFVASAFDINHNNVLVAKFDTPTSSAGDMAMWLVHHTDSGTYVLKRVTCGGADSAGGGWRALRVAN